MVKTATKAQKTQPESNGKVEKGLRPLQIKVLKVLDKAKGTLDRGDLYEALGFKQHSGLNDILGKNDPKARKEADEAKYPSLLSLGFIRLKEVKVDPKDEKVERRYEITPSGRKALAKVK